ncbi:MAG: response regulator, partial [Thiolinea sp.]
SGYVQGLGVLLSLLFIAAIQVCHTRQLRAEHARVKAAGEARSHFLNVMSHEIRAPLHVLIGINHLLQDKPTAEQQKDYLKKMDRAASNLLVISSNTLDLSQLDDDPEKFVLKNKPFDLDGLLRDIDDLFSVPAQQKGLRLVVDPLSEPVPVLLGDWERLLQVMFNLLDNAVKYTEAGEIRLACHLLDKNDKQATLIFHVRDTGIGIPAKYQDNLFQPFYRVNSRYGKRQIGTGLGLLISHRLVKKMGGLLAVDSMPGQGSHFFFTLKFPLHNSLAIGEEGAQKTGNEKSFSLQGIRILLVDDDEMNRLIGAKLLRNRGALVDEAEDGLSAINAVEQQSFDLIFMDISMPGLDGYETVRRIHAKGIGRLPIVALTALVSAEEKERCLLAGMDDYLAKPFQMAEMERIVLRYVQKHKAVG